MFWFETEGKRVSVYPAEQPDSPLVLLNTFAEETDKIREELACPACPDHTLVAVTGLQWNRDLCPWNCPPVSRKTEPCTGGADDYLKLLTGEILERAEKEAGLHPCWRAVAGYSLAGLFAIYSLTRTDLFQRAASISGSLWYPRFRAYLREKGFKASPEALYFSLGEQEHKTRSPLMKTVQKETEVIEQYCRNQGAATILEMNAGGHYRDSQKRTATGIRWLLNY